MAMGFPNLEGINVCIANQICEGTEVDLALMVTRVGKGKQGKDVLFGNGRAKQP